MNGQACIPLAGPTDRIGVEVTTGGDGLSFGPGPRAISGSPAGPCRACLASAGHERVRKEMWIDVVARTSRSRPRGRTTTIGTSPLSGGRRDVFGPDQGAVEFQAGGVADGGDHSGR